MCNISAGRGFLTSLVRAQRIVQELSGEGGYKGRSASRIEKAERNVAGRDSFEHYPRLENVLGPDSAKPKRGEHFERVIFDNLKAC